MIIAIILTICAIIIFASGKSIIDQIAAIGVWLGAMIAGLASYMNSVVTNASRNLAFRLINSHATGLKKTGRQQVTAISVRTPAP